MPDYDMVVVGSGFAGSTAALSFLEATEQAGRVARVALIEAGKKGTWPGGSRWSRPFLRLDRDNKLMRDRAGRAERDQSGYWRKFEDEVPDTVKFMQDHGVKLIHEENAALDFEGQHFAVPDEAQIKFTFGGLKVDPDGRVLDTDDAPIPGLYAAGEITGYLEQPPQTSVLRASTFGRIVGANVADSLSEAAAATG